MKTSIMALAAALMMSTAVMAQNEQTQGQNSRQMDRAAMMKARTEQMVKEYGLNEEQAKKLETLNTEYAEKLPMMRGSRQQGQARQGQRSGEQAGQGQAGQGQRRERQQGDSLRRGQRVPNRQINSEEMRKNMEEYNTSLEKIMTQEQYAKYRENMGRRMGNGQRNGGGNRPQRNDQ